MITVLFTCRECGLTDCEVAVEAREESQGVIWWMQEVVTVAIRAKHVLLAPLCMAKEMANLKIPIDTSSPDNWIGKQTEIVPPRGLPKGKGKKKP